MIAIWDGGAARLARQFLDFVRLEAAESVLDVGSGTGSLTALIATSTAASRIVGMLNVFSFTRGKKFDEGQRKMLSGLASRAATAIDARTSGVWRSCPSSDPSRSPVSSLCRIQRAAPARAPREEPGAPKLPAATGGRRAHVQPAWNPIGRAPHFLVVALGFGL